MYEQERVQQEEKIATMKEEGADEYNIRKQEEVLAETAMMIPNTRSRLEPSVEDREVEDLTKMLVCHFLVQPFYAVTFLSVSLHAPALDPRAPQT